MGNCLNPIFRGGSDQISHDAYDPSRTTRKLWLFSAPSTSTTWMKPSTLAVPSAQGSAGDCTPTPRTEDEILSLPNLKAFSFMELKRATRNFSHHNIIGEGGFGRVYKGWIDEQTLTSVKPGSGMVVAVKNLKPESWQGHNEWLAEVNHLGHLQHPNLVKLFGFCSEGDYRVLVYEFMPKGSLDNHLFGSGEPLSWATRIKIAAGVAKVLSFLHDSERPIIHRNVGASDILLDSDFSAKLSGFGIARAGPIGDMTHVSTRVMGTHGYAAPEYVATGRLSTKADVYGFGVLLLEILSGRRVFDRAKPASEQNLVDWASSRMPRVLCIIDSKLEGQYPKATANAAVAIALQCTMKEPKQRPRMSEVFTALEKL